MHGKIKEGKKQGIEYNCGSNLSLHEAMACICVYGIWNSASATNMHGDSQHSPQYWKWKETQKGGSSPLSSIENNSEKGSWFWCV